jgi:hypothetical protein
MRRIPSLLVGEGEDGGKPHRSPPPVSSPTRAEEPRMHSYMKTAVVLRKGATPVKPECLLRRVESVGRLQ